MPKFMDLFLAGKIEQDEIDDYVELWHESSTSLSLVDFLGMTEEQYTLWVTTDYIEKGVE